MSSGGKWVRRMPCRKVGGLGVAALVLALALPGCTPREPGREPSPKSTPNLPKRLTLDALDLDRVDQGTEPLRLVDYAGKMVLLDFWATWSEPCREEVPMLRGLEEEFSAQGLQVIGLVLDESAGGEAVQSAVAALAPGYPVAIASPGVRDAVGGVHAIPTRVLVGPEGRIVGFFPGHLPAETLREAIRDALAS